MRSFELFNPEKRVFNDNSEKLVEVLMRHCENEDPNFFRMLVSYYFGKIAATMRAEILTHNNTPLPINIYTVDLAPSGAGKGKSKSYITEKVLHQFLTRFKDETLPSIAERNMAKIAHKRAVRSQTDPDEELEVIRNEYERTGEWLSAFDSATAPALKQFRHKLLLSQAGALNFEMDEVGDNLTANADAFSKFLELYDKGNIAESLTKNTKENIRLSEIQGSTPCNLLLFGTPSSLLDGSKTEDEFHAMLEKGYARRCLFAFSRHVRRNLSLTAREIQAQRSAPTNFKFVEDFSEQLRQLAGEVNFKKQLLLDPDEEILHIEYSLYCRDRADKLGDFDTVRRTELEHRHFKALKLAATYAFIEGSPKITEQHIYEAIGIVEESGEQLDKLLTREGPYIKLAKFLGEMKRPMTHADLLENLPFYPKASSGRSDMLTTAIAWGYQNHIIIKRSFRDGIEFLTGEALQETSMDKLTVSYSNHVAYNYFNDTVSWDNLEKLVQMPDMHWASHHVSDGHRCEDKVRNGFNLIVIDVDGGTRLSNAQSLLEDYRALFYTTKRHGENGQDRFRIILPMKYELHMDKDDFREFMQNVYDWLPFEVDDQTNQRARKWLANQGTVTTTQGILFDPLEFIPKTSKNEERKEKMTELASLSNLERWFVNNTGMGNRSNQLIKYGLMLVDSGRSVMEVEQAIMDLNEKLADKLSADEIHATIMRSVQRAIQKRSA